MNRLMKKFWAWICVITLLFGVTKGLSTKTMAYAYDGDLGFTNAIVFVDSSQTNIITSAKVGDKINVRVRVKNFGTEALTQAMLCGTLTVTVGNTILAQTEELRLDLDSGKTQYLYYEWTVDGEYDNQMVTATIDLESANRSSSKTANISIGESGSETETTTGSSQNQTTQPESTTSAPEVPTEPDNGVEIPHNVKWNDNQGAYSISWDEVDGATSYNVYSSTSRYGTYTLVETTSETTHRVLNDVNNTYKVTALVNGEESAKSEAVSKTIDLFGKNVYIFDDTDNNTSIQSEVDAVFAKQESNQFSEDRYAILFKPGTYSDSLKVYVGFYTQVAGLGMLPTDVKIGGLECNANWNVDGNNHKALENFWRNVENFSVNSNVMWAVSQATSFRRMYVNGTVRMDHNGGYASGGFMANSYTVGESYTASQQQWFNRNNEWETQWRGGVWNIVNVGNIGNVAEKAENTIVNVDTTEEVQEKPFLTVDENDNYSVFVPELKYNSKGTDWRDGVAEGTSISIDNFYVAKPEVDTADTINEALKQGKHLLLTPGIYKLDKPIEVTNKNTVVLGLGLATLQPVNGNEAMKVADIDGVHIAGILFDAGETWSDSLCVIGDGTSDADHSENPVTINDVFFRVGGTVTATPTSCDKCLVINSNDVIGDNLWIWRADHGSQVGWNLNICNTGLVVNGDDVIFYGLFVEHFEKYQTIWNGDYGTIYFYQNEIPYDAPSKESWMSHDGKTQGYASLKVSDNVENFYALGLGIYSYFRDTEIFMESGIECPTKEGIVIERACSVKLDGYGSIKNIINHIGEDTKESGTAYWVELFNKDSIDSPVITPDDGNYYDEKEVSIKCETPSVDIYYTLDGTDPIVEDETAGEKSISETAKKYTEAFTVKETTQIKAVAINTSGKTSEIVDSTLTFNNLAAGIVPLVSSTNGINPGKSITDGNYNTRWYSSNVNPSAFLLDLGRMCNLEGYAIVGGGTKSYEIMISQDRQQWETIYTVADARGTGGTRVCNMFDKIYSARYVQVVFTERLVARYGNQVYEFELLGQEEDPKLNKINNPSNLEISAMGTKTLGLTWNSVVGAKEYKVYKSVATDKSVGAKYSLIGTTTKTEIQDVMGTDLCSYVVTAVTEYGVESEKSNFVLYSETYNYDGLENIDDSTIEVPTTQTPTTQAPTTQAPTTQEQTIQSPSTLKVKAPDRTKIKSASKKKAQKKVKLLIKKVKGAVGYKVQFSTTKKFKKVLVSKNVKKVNITIQHKKLKNKKILYVRVKAYKLNKSKKVWAKKWSKVKKVKVK